jgi:hypothetical protein
MTPDTPNPASAAARTGSGDAICLSSSSAADVRIDRPPRPNTQIKFQDSAPAEFDAEIALALTASGWRVAAPRPRRLEVRFHVLEGRCPYGRAGPFRLTDRDLDELIAIATRLEVRRLTRSPYSIPKQETLRENGCLGTNQDSRSPGHFWPRKV